MLVNSLKVYFKFINNLTEPSTQRKSITLEDSNETTKDSEQNVTEKHLNDTKEHLNDDDTLLVPDDADDGRAYISSDNEDKVDV
ncbi:unnamed protein product [Rhizophagus irregularis]|nr:unnamed protein product [Rhizophagus irregularis]